VFAIDVLNLQLQFINLVATGAELFNFLLRVRDGFVHLCLGGHRLKYVKIDDGEDIAVIPKTLLGKILHFLLT
jgi:hypothetical protein